MRRNSIGHIKVRPIKHISPPIIAPGDRSDRNDKRKPKNRFKDHGCGPAMRPKVERETRRLTKISGSESLRSNRAIAFLTHLQHFGPEKVVNCFNRPVVLAAGDVQPMDCSIPVTSTNEAKAERDKS